MGLCPFPEMAEVVFFSSFLFFFLHARCSEGGFGLDNARQVCVFVVRGWFSRGLFARPMEGFWGGCTQPFDGLDTVGKPGWRCMQF